MLRTVLDRFALSYLLTLHSMPCSHPFCFANYQILIGSCGCYREQRKSLQRIIPLLFLKDLLSADEGLAPGIQELDPNTSDLETA